MSVRSTATNYRVSCWIVSRHTTPHFSIIYQRARVFTLVMSIWDRDAHLFSEKWIQGGNMTRRVTPDRRQLYLLQRYVTHLHQLNWHRYNINVTVVVAVETAATAHCGYCDTSIAVEWVAIVYNGFGFGPFTWFFTTFDHLFQTCTVHLLDYPLDISTSSSTNW